MYDGSKVVKIENIDAAFFSSFVCKRLDVETENNITDVEMIMHAFNW